MIFVIRFDLTYEGLKQLYIEKTSDEVQGFDLTYEGLKHATCNDNDSHDSSFDLTYEGLKQKFFRWRRRQRYIVLILPMRD